MATRLWLTVWIAWLCTPLAATAAAFSTDPNSAELQALVKPLVVDESAYGCGPLRTPGATYYVAKGGDDAAAGSSWDTAWRHIHHGLTRLKAGDTLVIGEGEYVEPPLAIGTGKAPTGEPGRPITIAAAPRHRVVIRCTQQPELRRTADTAFTWEAELRLDRGQASVWETPSRIMLQQASAVASVDELPGTWSYDDKAGRLYVHFADSRGGDVHAAAVRPGRASVSHFATGDACVIDVRGSYLRFRDLNVECDNVGMVIQGKGFKDAAGKVTYSGGDHITVERCSFSSTCFAGLVLYAGAQWNLIRENYGTLNGARGSLLVNHLDANDNLLIRNRLDPSAPTVRTRGWTFHYGISTYGTVGRRNHMIDNIMNDRQSFRTKFMFKEHVLQGNVMLGACSTVPVTYYELQYEPQDRIIFRNNTFLGPVATAMQPMPPCGPGGNWTDEFKAFVNNFVADAKEGGVSAAAARFADPAYLDYRLQPDSPLRGKALGGGDLGASPASPGRIFYVGADGDDANPGTSEAQALKTLAKAAAALSAGDTLYVKPGTYAEPLTLAAKGREDAPITVRAFRKRETVLLAVRLAGAWTSVEGFTVVAEAGDGVTVSADHVTVRDCLIRNCAGAGLRAGAARALTVLNCTVVGNGTGMLLERGSTEATLRDSILALNRTVTLTVAADSATGFLAGANDYSGAGVDPALAARECGSVAADPGFVNAGANDYRLASTSPAAHLARFGQPAGACPVLPRVPEFDALTVTGTAADSATLTWRTPKDDTTATVRWRVKGTAAWNRIERREQGTVHGVGLTSLKPETEYEVQVDAHSRRGGGAVSDLLAFRTTNAAHEPATYYLAPDGDDAVDGRTLKTAWRTVRRASFAVAPGDTVLLAPGVYEHPIAPLRGGTAERRITFRRHGDDPVVIDGGAATAPLVELDAKHFITVEGITFANLPPEGHEGAVKVARSNGFELLRCRIGYKRQEGGFGNGINMTGCAGGRIEGNLIWGTRYHCVLNGCTDITIKNNTFAWGQVFSMNFCNKHTGCRFVGNIFYYPTSVPNAALAISYPSQDIELASDYNLFGPMAERTQVAYVYKGSVTDLAVTGKDLADWQRGSGRDAHSLQTDPLFVDPRAGDFRLRPDSPACGAGEGGADIGACGVRNLNIDGRTRLLPGEGRTLRLQARLARTPTGQVTFQWFLPDGSTRNGPELEYTPPPDLNSFEVKVTASADGGKTWSSRDTVSVPPVELAGAGKGIIVEGEAFAAKSADAEVKFYDPVHASGRAFHYWIRPVGTWLEWEFEVPTAGEYTFLVRYTTNFANARRRFELDGASPGPAYADIAFPSTGGWATATDDWAFKKLGPPLNLTAGRHRFRLTNLGDGVNIDYTSVAPALANP